MKRIFLILFLFSCARQPNEITSSAINDSIRSVNIKHLIYIRSQLDSIITTDSLIKIEIMQKKIIIDSLINKMLDQKEALIEANYIKSKIEQYRGDREKIAMKNDSLQKMANELNLQINLTKKELEAVRGEKIYQIKKNRDLQRKVDVASELKITGLSTKGIGVSYSLIGKPKEFETYKQSKVKKVLVSFVLPENHLSEKGKRLVSVTMYSFDGSKSVSKDTIIDFQGIEQKILLYLTPINIRSGRHDIEININKELKSRATINIL